MSDVLRSGGAPLPKGRFGGNSIREVVESTTEYREYVTAYLNLSNLLERMHAKVEARVDELGGK